MRVFVCYTSKDPAVTKDKLQQVEAIIKPFAKVFIDLLHNENGNQCRVDRELRRCDMVLQLTSPKYKSDWVQKEIITARKKEKPVTKIGIDELLRLNQDQIYLMLSDVDKKGWSVWSILVVSLLACVSVSMVGIWLSYLFVAGQVATGSEEGLLNARGLFGDSWGGVNAIISAFAFAGVIVTLFLQNRDLNLQRKEMARQREEFEKENETLKYQRFENLFYNMLNLQQEIVSSLRFDYQDKETVLVPIGTDGGTIRDVRIVDKVITGREVFRFTFNEVEISLQKKNGYGQSVTGNVYGYKGYLNSEGLIAYDTTWIPTYYDHYFRHLYKIIQFVDSQSFSFEEAYKYVSLLRGTLSRYELVWIYYNALNPAFIKFKKLIEKYSLLKNIREDLLTRCLETERYYEGLGLDLQMVSDSGFTTGDFEFYLTDNADEKEKYYISAFWKQDELQDGQKKLNSWRAFINKAAEKVVERSVVVV